MAGDRHAGKMAASPYTLGISFFAAIGTFLFVSPAPLATSTESLTTISRALIRALQQQVRRPNGLRGVNH